MMNENSYFYYYYGLLEKAIELTQVYENKDEQLCLSDKPELILLFSRVLEGITEFINCKIDSQFMIYNKRIDVWTGILLRKICDFDSPYYEMKWHIMNYLFGVIEGNNF